MRGQDVKRFAVAELCDHGSLSPACVHYNKPNIKQLKASLSVFEVAAVTQREPAGGRCLLEFRPRRKNPAADGRENSKDFKGKRTERIFNLWLIGLSSRGNDYLKTFWYFPHNAAEVGWGGGESGLSAAILCKCSFNQCQLLSAKGVTDSALWETLLSSASWNGTERLSTAQPGGKSHLRVNPPGLITETNHEENLTAARRRAGNKPPRSFGPGVNDWLWAGSTLWSSWLSSGGWKKKGGGTKWRSAGENQDVGGFNDVCI